jgi:hypothetical protein
MTEPKQNPFSKKDEDKGEEVVETKPEVVEEPKTRTRTPKSALSDLTDVDLVDQETGKALPLSATTKNLQAVVVNNSGRAILKVAVRGYIGEEPVSVLAEDAGEFGELIAALEKAATQQKKDQKAKK